MTDEEKRIETLTKRTIRLEKYYHNINNPKQKRIKAGFLWLNIYKSLRKTILIYILK